MSEALEVARRMAEAQEMVGKNVRVHVSAYIIGYIADVRRDISGEQEDATNNLIFRNRADSEIVFTDDDGVELGRFETTGLDGLIQLEVSEYELVTRSE